jgi:hypothetical protein
MKHVPTTFTSLSSSPLTLSATLETTFVWRSATIGGAAMLISHTLKEYLDREHVQRSILRRKRWPRS